MADIDWVQSAQPEFFIDRRTPSPKDCEQFAKSITKASEFYCCNSSGTLSYDIICVGCQGGQSSVIVTFREADSKPNDRMVEMTSKAFGLLAQKPTYYGIMPNSSPPLCTYITPCQLGSSLLSIIPCARRLLHQEIAKHIELMKSLAGYFARAWASKYPVEPWELTSIRQARIQDLLRYFERTCLPVVESKTIQDLGEIVPSLFKDGYPQVITNGHLSLTNVRVKDDTYELVNIVDWSMAKILPFGMDLYILFFLTGNMGISDWENYKCKGFLITAFWEQFWIDVQPKGDVDRRNTEKMAMNAGKIGAIFHYAFGREKDGSLSHVVPISDRRQKQLRAWLETPF